jgi:hypothetical protein
MESFIVFLTFAIALSMLIAAGVVVIIDYPRKSVFEKLVEAVQPKERIILRGRDPDKKFWTPWKKPPVFNYSEYYRA